MKFEIPISVELSLCMFVYNLGACCSQNVIIGDDYITIIMNLKNKVYSYIVLIINPAHAVHASLVNYCVTCLMKMVSSMHGSTLLRSRSFHFIKLMFFSACFGNECHVG